MAIEVQGPDGAVHEFPDGTQPTVIKAAMAKHYSPSGAAERRVGATQGQTYIGGTSRTDRMRSTFAGAVHQAGDAYSEGIADQYRRGAGGDPLASGMTALNAAGKFIGAFTGPLVNQDTGLGGTPEAEAGRDEQNAAHPFFFDPRHVATDQERRDAAGNIILSLVPVDAPANAALAAGRATAAGGRAVAAGTGRFARAVTAPAAPFAARFSAKAAEQQAAARLAAAAHDLPAARASLEAGPAEIVPGSKPTTFQQTGDIGLGAAERRAETNDRVPFAERRAEQNSARRDALGGIQSGGDPSDVAHAVRAHFNAVDASTQEAVDAATTAARARGEAIGGQGTPEAYGEQTRAAIAEAESAARAHEGRLWSAVDPEGKLTGNVTATRQAADDIVKAEASTAKPMAGEEAAIFEAARGLPATAPVRDLIALRSRVSTAMREELISAGRSPTYARLARLRTAIQDNLAGSISEAVQADQMAVAAGTMAQEDAAASRLQAEVDGWRQQRVEARAAVGGGDRPTSVGGTSALPGNAGAEVPAGGGPAAASGGPSLPPDAGGQPTFNAQAASDLAKATEATKARARTFGVDPIRAVTAKAGDSTLFRLPDGSVPNRIFKPGPEGFGNVQAAVRASPETLPVLEDFAAFSLRRNAMREDGTLDPAKFAAWRARHTDALRALPPETSARFADAASASQAVAEATANRTAALRSVEQSAVGRVLHLQDPEAVTRTVGSILGGRTAVTDMRQLADLARADPNALNGLRQAVADHITTRLIGNTEAGTSGATMIKADAFQGFLRQNRAALRQVFSNEEMSTLDAIAADIQRSKRSENALRIPATSNTEADRILSGAPTKGARSLLDVLAGGVGFAHAGPIGAIAGAFGVDFVQGLRAAGIQRVDQLVTQALLHPEVARALLARVPVKGTTAATTAGAKVPASRLLRALGAAAWGGASATKPQQRPTYAQAVGGMR